MTLVVDIYLKDESDEQDDDGKSQPAGLPDVPPADGALQLQLHLVVLEGLVSSEGDPAGLDTLVGLDSTGLHCDVALSTLTGDRGENVEL